MKFTDEKGCKSVLFSFTIAVTEMFTNRNTAIQLRAAAEAEFMLSVGIVSPIMRQSGFCLFTMCSLRQWTAYIQLQQ